MNGDTNCTLAKQFSGTNLSCSVCGPSDSTNAFCFTPGYVDDPPTWPLNTYYYNLSGSYSCAFVADPRTRPICPCL